MPYPVVRRKRQSKKRSYRITKYKGPGLSPNAPFAKSFLFKTRYVSSKTAVQGLGAGVPGTYIFSLNSLYDPDKTLLIGGHQPIGFDQMMMMYDHYTVIGARVRVTAWNQDPDESQVIALHIKDNQSVNTDSNNILENGLNRWALLGTTGSGSDTKTLSINCSISKFFGRKVLQGDKYSGSATTDPTDGVYLHITAIPVTGGAAVPLSIRTCVEIQYIAVLTEPKTLASS